MNNVDIQESDGLKSFLELKKRWMSFYENLGLNDLVEVFYSLGAYIDIAKVKKYEDLKDLSILFMPPVEVQKKYLEDLKNACETFDIEIWLSPWNVEKYFSEIKFLSRPDRPYLFLTEDQKEAPRETLNRSALDLRKFFKEKDKVGMNLFEYFVFHRDYTQRHSFFPDVYNAVWLLDSELPDGKILITGSRSIGNQMKVWALPSSYKEKNSQKARSGIVISL